MSKERRYVACDVFTTTRFGGNPLAVVLDADGLTTDQMQKIAREFNYSETTFVLPARDSANDANVRIFTPTFEMPFAGHPNVGTAFVLASEGAVFGRKVGDALRFEEIAGLVEMELARDGNGAVTEATLTAPQKITLGGTIPRADLAQALSLDVQDLKSDGVAASVGAAFILLELTSRAALERAKPDLAAYERLLAGKVHEGLNATGVHCWVRVDESDLDLRTRMFAPLKGVFEDPATGSANAALSGYLARDSATPIKFRIAQGVEMGRPSLLLAEASSERVRLGGSCVTTMRGVLLA
ncbi:MAG: PhzF family phenazine biosynthesis protein [Rhodospirillales bacterium]|nr:PhzF family phenazine biosynthesis protein [Rhodospirillales bacterium]